jgi:hypothetical protein
MRIFGVVRPNMRMAALLLVRGHKATKKVIACLAYCGCITPGANYE